MLRLFILYPKKTLPPVHVHLKKDQLDYLRSPMTHQFILNVLALENILVALTREIEDGPSFFVYKIFLDRCGMPYSKFLS